MVKFRNYLNSFKHSHKKRKDSLEILAVLLIFSLEMEISGVVVQSIHQNSINGNFREELLSEKDFETVLATSCCYGLGVMASEAVQKIATDRKEYRKCSSCVIICWIAKIYLSVTNCEKRLIPRTHRLKLKKLLRFHRKKSNNWPMVSFTHNGSEITTWMRYNFKTKSKSAKSQATFLRKTSFWISDTNH